MKKLTLNPRQLYTVLELKKMGAQIVLLDENRDTKDIYIKKKKKSIKKCKGGIIPILVIEASKCKEEGLTFRGLDGEVIEPSEDVIGIYFVVLDGQNRLMAYLQLIEEYVKAGDPEISYPDLDCMLCVPKVKIRDILQECNSVTDPWKGFEYLTSLLSAKFDGFVNDRIKFIHQLAKDGINNDAAHRLAQFDLASIPNRTELIEAGNDTEQGKKIRDRLSKTDNLADIKKLYPILKKHLGTKRLSYRDVAKWFANKYIDSNKNIDELIQFTETISADDTDSTKTGTGKIVDRIISMLDKKYTEFKGSDTDE